MDLVFNRVTEHLYGVFRCRANYSSDAIMSGLMTVGNYWFFAGSVRTPKAPDRTLDHYKHFGG